MQAASSSHPDSSLRLARISEVSDRTGHPRATIYRRIKAGLFPPGIPVAGSNTVAWPDHEISDYVKAVISGAGTDEIRSLVTSQIQDRGSEAQPSEAQPNVA